MSSYKDYWKSRSSLLYYQRAIGWILGASPGERIIDVGSADTPLVLAGSFADRVTVNLEEFPPLAGVTRHVGSFLSLDLPPADAVICLQVMEHLSDEETKPFAEKLLRTGRRVLLSVPWRWPAGSCGDHRQDPIDEQKIEGWFGAKPVWSDLIRDGSVRRYMAEFAGAPR